MNTITTYHVFGDGWDNWFNTLGQATKAFEKACEDEQANVRLYQDVSEVDGDTVEETCLAGQGCYPS